MSSRGCNGWKLIGMIALVAAGAAFVSMIPDLKRYLKIEAM